MIKKKKKKTCKHYPNIERNCIQILHYLLFKVLKCIFLCTLQIWSLNKTSIEIKINSTSEGRKPKEKCEEIKI